MKISHDHRVGMVALGIGAKLLVSAVALSLFIGMAKRPPVPPPQQHQPARQMTITSEAVAPLVKQYLQDPHAAPLNAYVVDLAALRRFYEARNFAPVWMAKGQADAALAVLAQAGNDGLYASLYHADALTARKRLVTAAAIAEYDLLLSDGILHYARDMRRGRVTPNSVEHDIAPPHSEYAELKKAYIRYREIDARGGWPALPAGTDVDSPLLMQRLAFEDSSGGDAESALKRYQARNGMNEDGVLNKATLASLNVPASQRAEQIMINMERWRWVPEFGSRYIEVNTADATLQVFDGGKQVLASRIIVGKRATPTPMFAATVTDVTANPPWSVPASIARNEMLPKLRRNPNYLASEHIVLLNGPEGDPYGLSINWDAISAKNFRYEFRQTPGDDNALGYVKLEMANKFNSYLHDTPSRKLFARDERHLSHGCMRVEQIQQLASFALTGNVNAGLTQIKSAIETHATQHISLDRKLPVYVLYWTAIADAVGTAGFRPDVYGRDAKLLAALAGQRPVGRVSVNDTACTTG